MDKQDIERALEALNHLKDCLDGCMAEHELNTIEQALQSALDDYVFDEKCVKGNNRIYIKNVFVRQPPQDKDEE